MTSLFCSYPCIPENNKGERLKSFPFFYSGFVKSFIRTGCDCATDSLSNSQSQARLDRRIHLSHLSSAQRTALTHKPRPVDSQYRPQVDRAILLGTTFFSSNTYHKRIWLFDRGSQGCDDRGRTIFVANIILDDETWPPPAFLASSRWRPINPVYFASPDFVRHVIHSIPVRLHA